MLLTAHYLASRFPRGLHGVVFDCDGVLFDSRAANMRYYNLILEKLGLGPMTAAQEDYVHMHTVGESLVHIIPPAMHDRMGWARKQVDYLKEIVPSMEPEPGLLEFLALLRDNGVRMAVHTNRTNSMEYVLDVFDMSGFFHPVMTASKVVAKPHPEGVNKVLEAWECGRDEIAFVGDSLLDSQAAHSAEVPFWAFRNETLQAERHINDFWSLRAQFVQYFSLLASGCSRPALF
ncbi:HAD-superfamily hydrolase, subfamily IA, variant 1 [Oleidesulfovibrio alaskensis G20]|uniref:phosphoglycolate phosphatase n=1 Tax=Oleidesulfovibrio alaskensis (strain ATCC BAA-1058 / DSM 17464 / G20) TaxID=207559 RepID=Q30ZC6_OLEA2|nr:HAD-IA family hydrolase [Oleidesulfovibrio alaskensis]ABB38970.1 HAD-superfamily hydrolase, subfamily IA, variant 1 [Oleidesulfovibrio alaskensis G20]MBG0772247.1 HAD-IA family hydrolase [Oleidesulfovibrio alaskensis]MBL3583324.1 HAD-IA family hydrolase [Oleidesulfovibrio alaskensis]